MLKIYLAFNRNDDLKSCVFCAAGITEQIKAVFGENTIFYLLGMAHPNTPPGVIAAIDNGKFSIGVLIDANCIKES